MEKNHKFRIPSFGNINKITLVRDFINKYFFLKKISKSVIFEIIMLLILFVNFIAIVVGSVVTDGDLISNLDLIDDICLYLYIIEAIIKIIGLGLEKYFDDD